MPIRLREMEKDSEGRTYRACGGCGREATHQIVGQTVVGNKPATESVDLCERCGGSLANKLTVRHAANGTLPTKRKAKIAK